MSTAEMLCQLIEILQRTGSADSLEVQEFMEKHSTQEEFLRLGETSLRIWRMFHPSKQWWQFWK